MLDTTRKSIYKKKRSGKYGRPINEKEFERERERELVGWRNEYTVDDYKWKKVKNMKKMEEQQ